MIGRVSNLDNKKMISNNHNYLGQWLELPRSKSMV